MNSVVSHVPEWIYSSLTSLVIFGILVFVHELGHFLVAKWCGVGVIEFAIGFGKKIFRCKYGNTYYSLGIVPLGGYVKMVGEEPFGNVDEEGSSEDGGNPGSVQVTESAAAGSANEAAGSAGESGGNSEWLNDKSWWFSHKPLSQRIAIVLAGPGFNILFAILFAIVSFAIYGKVVPVPGATVGEVVPDNPAAKAGLQRGDIVISIDGKPVANWEELAKTVRGSGGKEMQFLVERQNDGHVLRQEIGITGTTDIPELEVLEGKPRIENAPPPYKIGILPGTKRVPVGIKEAVGSGVYQVWHLSRMTVHILGAVVAGVIEPQKVVGGPIAVFATAAQSARRGMEAIIDFLVLLSVSLAIFNLLPIPVLDGGHLLFFLIEALRGSPLSVRWQMVANQLGMILLMALMIFALRNDVLRYF